MRERIPLARRLRVEVVVHVIEGDQAWFHLVHQPVPGESAVGIHRRVDAVERRIQRKHRALADQSGGSQDAVRGLQVEQADRVVRAEQPPPAPAALGGGGQFVISGQAIPAGIFHRLFTSVLGVLAYFLTLLQNRITR